MDRMLPNGRADTIKEKKIARIKYANRQIDKFIKASLKNKGCLRWRDLVAVQKILGVKVY